MNISDLFIEYIIMGLITVCGLITGYCIYNQIDLISFIEYHIKSSFFNTMSAGTLVTILLIYPLGMVIDNIAKFIAKPMYRSSFILQDTYYESAGYKAKDERIREAHKSQSSDRLNILKNGNENFIYQYKRQKHYTYVLRTLFVLSLMNLYVALYIMVRIINVKYEVILLLLFSLPDLITKCLTFY